MKKTQYFVFPLWGPQTNVTKFLLVMPGCIPEQALGMHPSAYLHNAHAAQHLVPSSSLCTGWQCTTCALCLQSNIPITTREGKPVDSRDQHGQQEMEWDGDAWDKIINIAFYFILLFY